VGEEIGRLGDGGGCRDNQLRKEPSLARARVRNTHQATVLHMIVCTGFILADKSPPDLR